MAALLATITCSRNHALTSSILCVHRAIQQFLVKQLLTLKLTAAERVPLHINHTTTATTAATATAAAAAAVFVAAWKVCYCRVTATNFTILHLKFW
jgi:hypothetical protein